MADAIKQKMKPPYPFVLEALAALQPEVRRMFGGFAVYVGDRLVLMLRDNVKGPRDNGVWLVLAEGADPGDVGLREEFPSLRRIEMLGDVIRHWLLVPSDGADFETEALRACELILQRDGRIGRVPESRK